MKVFLENLPAGHWSFDALLIIGVISFAYVLFFFFSQEGRDERGRGIFASASVITFLLMIIISQIYEFNASEWIISERAFTILNWLQLSTLGVCQSICITIFRKIR